MEIDVVVSGSRSTPPPGDPETSRDNSSSSIDLTLYTNQIFMIILAPLGGGVLVPRRERVYRHRYGKS